MKTKLSILISVVITLLILIGVYYLVPIGFIESPIKIEPTFGTTITTINGSDTLSSSRTTINNNFTNLNAGKIENSSTSIAAITTLSGLTTASSLSTVGTITSGVWTGTAISVAKGGTGTTTPALNYVILGNTTSGFKTVAGLGNSGQLLTSAGAGNPPAWGSPSVDTTLDYVWTGTHTFTDGLIASSSVLTVIASSTQYRINAGSINASSTINVAGVSVDGSWSELGETVLSGAANSISVANFPARKDLKVIFYASTTAAAGTLDMTFNSDTGSNYAFNFYRDYVTAVSSANDVHIDIYPVTTASSTYYSMDILNNLSDDKIIFLTGRIAGKNLINLITGSAFWNSSAQITTINIAITGGANFRTGTRLTVYGKKN